MSSLFARLARCALCGGPIVICGGRHRLYGCSHFHRRGKAVCRNNQGQAVAVVDAAFLDTFMSEAMTRERLLYTARGWWTMWGRDVWGR